MAERDALTGLAGRGALDIDLSKVIADAGKSGWPLSVIMVDLDHFKQVNDTHGHLKGDAVLSGFASRIACAADGKGEVYRYGGEELLIVLRNHDVREATALAERMRRELESVPVDDLHVTASFGVATFPDHGKSPEELIQAADKAMYDAKNHGRNLVRFHGEPAPTREKTREPERKLPEPGKLTEEQKHKLRQLYFRGYPIECPEDGTILAVDEIDQISSSITRLQIRCKMCGFMDEI